VGYRDRGAEAGAAGGQERHRARGCSRGCGAPSRRWRPTPRPKSSWWPAPCPRFSARAPISRYQWHRLYSAGSSLLVTVRTLRFVICSGTEYLSVAAIAYCLLSCYSTCAVRLLFSRRPIVSHFECLFVGELLYFAILIKTNLGNGSMFLEAEL